MIHYANIGYTRCGHKNTHCEYIVYIHCACKFSVPFCMIMLGLAKYPTWRVLTGIMAHLKRAFYMGIF